MVSNIVIRDSDDDEDEEIISPQPRGIARRAFSDGKQFCSAQESTSQLQHLANTSSRGPELSEQEIELAQYNLLRSFSTNASIRTAGQPVAQLRGQIPVSSLLSDVQRQDQTFSMDLSTVDPVPLPPPGTDEPMLADPFVRYPGESSTLPYSSACTEETSLSLLQTSQVSSAQATSVSNADVTPKSERSQGAQTGSLLREGRLSRTKTTAECYPRADPEASSFYNDSNSKFKHRSHTNLADANSMPMDVRVLLEIKPNAVDSFPQDSLSNAIGTEEQCNDQEPGDSVVDELEHSNADSIVDTTNQASQKITYEIKAGIDGDEPSRSETKAHKSRGRHRSNGSKKRHEDDDDDFVPVSKRKYDELDSDELDIGLPKEMYKPRPSRSRSNRIVDETAEVTNVSKMPAKNSKRMKRARTTGTLPKIRSEESNDDDEIVLEDLSTMKSNLKGERSDTNEDTKGESIVKEHVTVSSVEDDASTEHIHAHRLSEELSKLESLNECTDEDEQPTKRCRTRTAEIQITKEAEPNVPVVQKGNEEEEEVKAPAAKKRSRQKRQTSSHNKTESDVVIHENPDNKNPEVNVIVEKSAAEKSARLEPEPRQIDALSLEHGDSANPPTTPKKSQSNDAVSSSKTRENPTKGPQRHSPIGRVRYRVGLSRKARIEPLLKLMKK